MKALTLHQPWAWAIVSLPPHAAKRIENRTWAPPSDLIGQRFAIHAGKTWDPVGARTITELIAEFLAVGDPDIRIPSPQVCGQGVLVGTAKLVGALPEVGEGLFAGPNDGARFSRDDSWFSGPWGWCLSDVVRHTPHIKCRGFQGLWTVPERLGFGGEGR